MSAADGATQAPAAARKARGGARAGSGPKPADGASGTRRVQLTLDAATLDVFRFLGAGNVSLGAREAARLAAQHAAAPAASAEPDTPTAGV